MRASLPRRSFSAIVLLALVAGACSGSGAEDAAPARARTTMSTTSSTTSTTEAPTTTTEATTTTAPPPPPVFQRGSTGPEIQAMEQKLADLRFDTGKVDGSFDAATGHAVMAFQKEFGHERTGKATPDLLQKIASAGLPGPMMGDGGGNRVAIDLKKQILHVYKGGELLRVLSVSTGNEKRYCVKGECDVAITPGGSFKVQRRIRGLRVSRLGELYNPLYFNGGIAMHGSASVPAYAASHGCVRIPMNSSLWLFDNVPNGTPVYVLGGKRAPVPFNEQAPPATEETTSTTAAPTTTTEAPTTTVAPTTTTPAPTTTTAPPTTTTSTPPIVPDPEPDPDPAP